MLHLCFFPVVVVVWVLTYFHLENQQNIENIELENESEKAVYPDSVYLLRKKTLILE